MICVHHLSQSRYWIKLGSQINCNQSNFRENNPKIYKINIPIQLKKIVYKIKILNSLT